MLAVVSLNGLQGRAETGPKGLSRALRKSLTHEEGKLFAAFRSSLLSCWYFFELLRGFDPFDLEGT
jgi:hypothetical protein